MDYINKEKLLEEMTVNVLPKDAQHLYLAMRGMVRNAPTADVVEVVRCKDCSVPHNKWTGCPHLNGLIPPPNFYCAKGERSTDNG